MNELDGINPDPDSCQFTYAASSLLDYIIIQLVRQDLYKALYALAFVGICMLVHTGSLVLSLFGVVNSVLAFPLGYAMYREVFGYGDLSVLSVCSVFVVLGIAVDDLFVFVDYWRQQDRRCVARQRVHAPLCVCVCVCVCVFYDVVDGTMI